MKYYKLALIIPLIILGKTSSLLAQGRLDRPSFFRDGQLQMEQEIQRLQQQQDSQQQQVNTGNIEHPSQLLTVDEGKLQWQKYIFREGGFSVWMPQAVVQTQESVVLNLGKSNLAFEEFATQPKTYRFVAAYSDPLTAEQLADPSQLLSAVRDGIVMKTNFTLKSDRPVTWQQYSGRELIMQNQGEIISFRVYLINQRVYVLAAGQQHTEALSNDISSFFDSFRLLQ